MNNNNTNSEIIEALHLVIAEFDENPMEDDYSNEIIIEVMSSRIEQLISEWLIRKKLERIEARIMIYNSGGQKLENAASCVSAGQPETKGGHRKKEMIKPILQYYLILSPKKKPVS